MADELLRDTSAVLVGLYAGRQFEEVYEPSADVGCVWRHTFVPETAAL